MRIGIQLNQVSKRKLLIMKLRSTHTVDQLCFPKYFKDRIVKQFPLHTLVSFQIVDVQEFRWKPWKFITVPRNWWTVWENQRMFMNDYFHENKLRKWDDW